MLLNFAAVLTWSQIILFCFVVNCSFTLLNVNLGAWCFVCMPNVMCSCKAGRDTAPISSQWIKITSHLSTNNSGKPNYFKMGLHCIPTLFLSFKIVAGQIEWYDPSENFGTGQCSFSLFCFVLGYSVEFNHIFKHVIYISSTVPCTNIGTLAKYEQRLLWK